MKRREFITLLGGAAVSWPLAARAQPSGQMRRIGVLMVFGESDAEAQSFVAALRDGLQKLGWNDANARLDIRWGGSEAQRLRAYAADLVALKPDVIVAGATSALAPLKQATQTIPIVFVQVSDPVRGGFVPSIAHPGGNITGFALYEYEIVEKWLELLKQLAPMVDRVCVLYDPTNPTNRGQLPEIESRAPAFAVRSSTFPVGDAREIEHAIGTFASEPNGTPNTSGAIVGAALAKLGILDEIKGKTRHASLAVGGELVAKGEVELGFFNLSEIPKGVTVAGALPGPLQGYTVYEAAVLSKGSTDQAATAFVKYLASAPAAAHWEAAKLEPATTYMPTRAGR